ncbi:MAG: formylglycine-generating enzyme family protein [Planctomycetota bacterium]
MAHGTRDGNDLYFIWTTLERLGAAEEELRDLAADARSRLFEHVGEPPRELFATVKTLDGRTDLWTRIDAGTFSMGAEDDTAGRRVKVEQAFELMSVPVTNAMYAAFAPDHEFPDGKDDHPAVNVNWYEAKSFCHWLGARLPTEKEWEYACRAGEAFRNFWSGETDADLGRVGWYQQNAGTSSHPVGEKPASPFGLYDMHGNVWAWCEDGLGSEFRVFRGGSFLKSAQAARSAYRVWYDPSVRLRDLGFRPARVITD